MNDQTSCVVTIMGKEYRVSCGENEKNGLLESARYLDEKMRSLQSEVGMVGADRLAIIVALNITHEMLQSQGAAEHLNNEVKNRLAALGKKIENSLNLDGKLDL